MSSNDTENVLASIDNIKMYIMRLSSSSNRAIDMMINQLETELKSYQVYELPPNVTAISQYPEYPYGYREVPNALKIMMKIGIANGKNEINTTEYKDYIKELESKLIEIYNAVKLET